MSRILSLAGLGLLAACLTLAAPSVSHAQGYYYGHDGHGHADGYRGSNGYRGYGYSGYGYSGYGSGRYGYSGYGNYGQAYRRPTIVHPEYEHWTPSQGWHTHGHLHVPHRGHYHTLPY